MNFHKIVRMLCLVFALLLTHCRSVLSKDETFFKISDESRIYLNGKATLHNWACEATVVLGLFEINMLTEDLLPLLDYIEQPLASDPNDLTLHHASEKGGLVSVYLEIPIRSLECGDRFMEKDLRKVLKEKYYPTIHYHYLSLKHVTRAPERRGLCLEVEGIFEMAGVQKTIITDFSLSKVGASHLRLRGSHLFRMTEFGVIPPSALFGLLRAYNEVEVFFAISLAVEK